MSMTNQQIRDYYTAIRLKEKKKKIGQAFIQNKWKDVEFIERTVVRENFTRVIHRDEQNRRITSFVRPDEFFFNK